MKRILLHVAILLLFVSVKCYSQTKSGLLTYNDKEKVEYRDTVKNCSDGFTICVKRILSRYSVKYNSEITQQVNKMDNYIIYEDSTNIIANIKIQTFQALQRTLWNIEGTFKKKGDNIEFVMNNITVFKNSSTITGSMLLGSYVEGLDGTGNMGQMRQLSKGITSLIKDFKNL
jgi:hypothetical protein